MRLASVGVGQFAAFAERGFHKATLQDAVRVFGLSPGPIYCHLASTEDSVYAVIEARHHGDLQKLELALHANSLEKVLVLPANPFFRATARREDHCWQGLLCSCGLRLQDAALLDAVRDYVDKPRCLLTDLVRSAWRREELPHGLEPEPAARVLIVAFKASHFSRRGTKAWTPARVFAPVSGSYIDHECAASWKIEAEDRSFCLSYANA